MAQLTFEKMQEAYAQQQEAGDRYLDTYKQVYELSKLNRDLNKSIDSTDSIKGKQALRDLQEEINRLQESDAEMSQYDLDYLRKKYDLRVAEIALEEAQNAKSQVRMQRDAEGNWGYVYTADESKTADAAQNYEDKLYEMQELIRYIPRTAPFLTITGGEPTLLKEDFFGLLKTLQYDFDETRFLLLTNGYCEE